MSMNLPKKIDIGFRTFKVIVREDLGSMGSVNNNKRIIQIEKGQNKHDMVDTVLHECLHVMVDDSKLIDESDEEKIVSVFANKLTELFIRNPKLLDWMRQQVKEIDK